MEEEFGEFNVNARSVLSVPFKNESIPRESTSMLKLNFLKFGLLVQNFESCIRCLINYLIERAWL